MTLCELAADTPEADAMARKILTGLYDLAAAAQGARLSGVRIKKQNAPGTADPRDALPGPESEVSGPETVIGDKSIIAQNGGENKP